MLMALCVASFLFAALPAVLFLANLTVYRPLRAAESDPTKALPSVSVLIPARNEETSIKASVEAALASTGVDLEVVVLDDHSEDSTAAVVAALVARDPRARLQEGPALPVGWCGKQHACAALAALATRPVLVFLDADVRLAPDALARLTRFLDDSGADLVSGFPREEAVGLVEQMVIPLIHFVLLGFLPLRRMRTDNATGLAAGCGQLFVTTKSAYDRMGGHGAVRASLHDGVKLPRAYRAAGLKTDLCDATDLAACRMYRTSGELWSGLAKNATEALAAPALIGPATLVLLGGQVLPVALTALALGGLLNLSAPAFATAAAGTFAAYLPRLVGVARFRQPIVGAVLHPLGVVILLTIQWYALGRDLLGGSATWKGRAYPARSG